MNDIVISGVSHTYGRKRNALCQLSLTVPKGEIFGLIGSNGAGKTTTLQLILGLQSIQQGQISVFGKELSTSRKEILRRIGSLIEAPSLYGNLTVKENLIAWQRIYKIESKRVEVVLDQVALTTETNKRAKHLSLGMKQRLGIAIALLHQPDLLILDEPINGLDPIGIIEIRLLLDKLNKEHGTTILISSHILSELEKLVTSLAIIGEGRLLFEGSISEIKQMSNRVSIKSNDNDRVSRLFKENFHTIRNGFVEINVNSQSEISGFIQTIMKNGIELYEVKYVSSDLESTFMRLTQ